jgi:hypothetical protein
MNVLCEWCDTAPGRWRDGAWLCDPCRDARNQLDHCEPAGIARPSADELEHAERVLAKAGLGHPSQ